MLSLLVLLFIVLNILYRRTNAYREQFVDVRKSSVKNAQEKKLQIVNLGSNQPKFAFDYSNLPIRGENWAVGPQTLEYDFAILRHSVSRLEQGAVVCIPLCLLQFFLYRHKDRSKHIRYYDFLGMNDIVGYSKTEYLTNIVMPLIGNPKKIKRLIKDSSKDTRLELEENPMTTEDELKADAEYWINCWNREFNITIPYPKLSEANQYEINKNIGVLHEMIHFCEEKALRPVVVLLPVTQYLYSRFSETFIENHLLNYIHEASPEITLINYMCDDRFTDPELYINSFFMNKRGRQKFTESFIEDLKRNSIL